MADYKKIYESYYNIEILSGFDIHHIDNNRKNNDISNLLMLPHLLHVRYHNSLNEYMKMQKNGSFNGLLRGCNQYNFSNIIEFGEVLEECQKWLLYKMELEQKRMLSKEVKNGTLF